MSESVSSLKHNVHHALADLVTQLKSKGREKLPSEREMVAKFATTRITLRDALSRLETAGLIYRSNRRGWFIAPPRLTLDLAQKVNFNELAHKQGRRPDTQVCHAGKATDTAMLTPIQEALQLSADKTLMVLRRVRSLDQRPILIEDIYLPTERFPQILEQNLAASITDLQASHYGIELSHESTRIRVMALPNDMIKPLNTVNSAPCLQITRLRFDTQGKAIDFNKEYWLHNAIELTSQSQHQNSSP